MNRVILTGRLTKEPEIKYINREEGGEQLKVARFSLAVKRKYSKGSDNAADFIGCVAFDKIADISEKYLKKGIKINLEGRIQTGSYDNKDGKKVYTTDVVVENIEFAESKSSSSDENVDVNDKVDDEYPF